MSNQPDSAGHRSRRPAARRCRGFRTLLSSPLSFAGVVIILLLVSMSLFAPLIAPYDPNDQDIYNVLAVPSAQHWLGPMKSAATF